MNVIVPEMVSQFTNLFVILKENSCFKAIAEAAKLRVKRVKAKYPLK